MSHKIYLRTATVEDARYCYRNNIPLQFVSMELCDGMIICEDKRRYKDDRKPYINSLDELDNKFIFDGSLYWNGVDEYGNNVSGVIDNWLIDYDDGPYWSTVDKKSKDNNQRGRAVNNPSEIVYLNKIYNLNYVSLNGYHSRYPSASLQICSDPLNILSEDCMDGYVCLAPL